VPLTRESVTAASRVMLPAYVLFFAALGGNYILTPTSRLLDSPGLRYANGVMPLRVWGALFLISAALMLIALGTHKRILYRYALLLCGLTMLLLTIVYILAAFHSDATPAGWIWPALVVAACAASYRSITARGVD
jgi:hypothetical protein